jgi:hypothetical protein
VHCRVFSSVPGFYHSVWKVTPTCSFPHTIRTTSAIENHYFSGCEIPSEFASFVSPLIWSLSPENLFVPFILSPWTSHRPSLSVTDLLMVNLFLFLEVIQTPLTSACFCLLAYPGCMIQWLFKTRSENWIDCPGMIYWRLLATSPMTGLTILINLTCQFVGKKGNSHLIYLFT